MPLAALSRFAARWDAFTAAPTPPLAVEIAAAHVATARLPHAGIGKLEGLRATARALPPGAVTASAVAPNFADRAAVAAALHPLLESLDAVGAEATLLLPDLTARLALLSFDELPVKSAEWEPLARFRLRKSLPFAEDQAVISCQALGGARLLVAFADRARLAEYEDCLEAAGARAACVLPSGLACLAAHPLLEEAALLLRADSGCLTSAFCRQGRVEFFRALEVGAQPAFDDVFPSVAYFRDALGDLGAAAAAAPVLYCVGLPPPLQARLLEETPWAQLRAAEAPEGADGAAAGAVLAVAGALRGRFA